jgi:hypothetical protein
VPQIVPNHPRLRVFVPGGPGLDVGSAVPAKRDRSWDGEAEVVHLSAGCSAGVGGLDDRVRQDPDILGSSRRVT